MSDPNTPLKDIAQQLQPVFITAPTARNGITLVQRLLNSTRQIMVYGENLAFVQNLPDLVYGHVSIHQSFGQKFADVRQRFVAGETETWSSNLWPDTNAMMMLAFEWFWSAAALQQQSAQSDGFARWGLKNPMPSPQMIDRLAALLQNARFIFLYRNLFDVVRSAKARKFVKSTEDVRNFANQWQTHLMHVLDRPSPRVLIMRHEDLTTDPAVIDELERFTGLNGIDRSVLDRKINTFQGDTAQGLSPTGYIQPEALTPEEADAIREVAAAALQRTGYDDQ